VSGFHHGRPSQQLQQLQLVHYHHPLGADWPHFFFVLFSYIEQLSAAFRKNQGEAFAKLEN
jgi:hypothetical protein